MVVICVIMMFFPKPLVAYFKERMIFRRNRSALMSPHMVANQENIGDDIGKGMQIELQQVFLKNVNLNQEQIIYKNSPYPRKHHLRVV